MDSIPNLKRSDVEEPLMILDLVRETGLLERFDVDIQARLEDIRERVRVVTAEWYEKKMAGLQETPGVNRALPLLLLTDDLEKGAQTLDKRFPEPILGCVLSSLPTQGGFCADTYCSAPPVLWIWFRWSSRWRCRCSYTTSRHLENDCSSLR